MKLTQECPVCGPPATPDYDSRWEEGREPTEAEKKWEEDEKRDHNSSGGCRVQSMCGLCLEEYERRSMGNEAYEAMIAYYNQEYAEMVAACTCGRMR